MLLTRSEHGVRVVHLSPHRRQNTTTNWGALGFSRGIWVAAVALRPCRDPGGTRHARQLRARAGLDPAPPPVALLPRGHAERLVRRLRPRAPHDAPLRARDQLSLPTSDPIAEVPGPGGPHGVPLVPLRSPTLQGAERSAVGFAAWRRVRRPRPSTTARGA